MTHKLKAIVLHCMKYKENSAIVYLYTDKFGRQSYIVNGFRGAKTKGTASFQPLFLLNIEAYQRPKTDLQRLKEYQLAYPLQSIPFSTTKSTLALFISELLYRLVREEEPNSKLFDFLYHSVQILDSLEAGVANFHLHFLAKLSQYFGFYPSSGSYTDGSYFDIKTGDFCAIRPSHPQYFSAENAMLLNQIMQSSVIDVAGLELNRNQRRSFLSSMMDFYSYHFDNKLPIRSLQIMRELFND